MKNMDSKARTQVIFGTLLFALVLMAGMYTMINFPQMYIVLVALAVVDLVCLYVIINGWMIIQELKSQKWEERYECIFKSEKASYLLMKKYFEELEEKLERLTEVSEIPTEEIINAQKAAARVVINRCRDNTTTLIRSNEQTISGIDEVRSLFSEFQNNILSLQQNIEESNDRTFQMRMQEMTVALKDMELRLNNSIMQSQKVIAQAPVMAAPVQQAVPVQMQAPESVPVMAEAEPEIISEQAAEPVENSSVPEPEETIDTGISEEIPVSEEAKTEESQSSEDTAEPEMIPDTESEALTEESSDEPAELEAESEPEVESEPAEESNEEKPQMPDLSDPDKTLDMSEIGALFASMNVEMEADRKAETESEPEEPELTPVVEEEPEPEESSEVEQAEEEPEENPEPEPEEEKPPMPDLSDPNLTLDPAEIDALFASMNAEMEADKKAETESEPEEPEVIPAVEEEPEPEESSEPEQTEEEPEESSEAEQAEEEAEENPEPELEEEKPPMPDPNLELDPAEIDALFASMNAEMEADRKAETESEPEEPEVTPVVEEEPEPEESPEPEQTEEEPEENSEPEQAEEEPEENPEPEPEEEKPPMPDLSDPNKALDADEIAALFANMEGESTPEPEPEPEEEKPPMPDLSDPNKALDADEIAALFANMGS